MTYITAEHRYAGAAEFYVEDHGDGPPVVLIHGYPLDARSWAKQSGPLLAAGRRVVTYDRRGFGRSPAAVDGFDVGFDVFAADLDALLTGLDLVDVVLVGHAMGTGEIVRYLGTYGSARVARAVLLAPLPPYLLRTEQTPDGLDLAEFDALMARARRDHAGYLSEFVDAMFDAGDSPGGELPVTDAADVATWKRLAAELSPRACTAMIPTWITDFRSDLAAIDVPVLVMQGDRDRVLPIGATGCHLRTLLPKADHIEIVGAPHALHWTHDDRVNRELLDFIGD
ncbi:alpha/beta hydrolase [Streptomyces sp. NPDC051020]|uniref:alpha/beta fold hydrolase n=1 Tax=Streptomyces sp. NPDC051020 TaxID=3155409 RepID=UPI00343BD823